jgi:DNA-binding IclR family transcriptional regulator
VALKPGARSQTLRWGLEILCLFTNERPEWGITEIAQKMGLQKSRVHRAVKTLEDAGFLRRDSATRKYSLGFRTIELGSRAARRIGLFAQARLQLAHLAAKTKATVCRCGFF